MWTLIGLIPKNTKDRAVEEEGKGTRKSVLPMIIPIAAAIGMGIAGSEILNRQRWEAYNQKSAQHIGDAFAEGAMNQEGVRNATSTVSVLSDTEISVLVKVEHESGRNTTIICYVKGGKTRKEQKNPIMSCSDSTKNQIV